MTDKIRIADFEEDLSDLELNLRHIRLLLDRQYLDPFKRDEKANKEVRTRIHS